MARIEVTLQGGRYLGKFSASEKKTERWVGSEYAEHLEDFYYWEGIGIIEDTQTNEAHRFFFNTPGRESGRHTLGELENEIVRIEGEWGRETNPQIIEKKSVYDVVLQQMYEDAREGEETEIIPSVFPKALNYEELLNRALVADEKSGQISLPM